MKMPSVPVYCFVAHRPVRVNVLLTKVRVSAAFDPSAPPSPKPEMREYSAIWDTGATNSVITQQVVDELGLAPTGIAMVRTAADDAPRPVEAFLVNMMLPNSVGVSGLRVSKGALATQTQVLIGMDIIGQGDFAVTNLAGKTTFTFRMPSIERIDFTAGTASAPLPNPKARAGRNDPCPCGSGRKYKRCHLAKDLASSN